MISNDLNERETYWISLEGTDLSETLRLESCSDIGEDSAAFRARTGESIETAANAKLYRLDEDTVERQLQIWQTVKELRHPNLIRVIESGKKRVAEGELLYVVFENADEILDRVLLERPLDRAEAKDVFLSIVRALNALHVKNLVHGSLSPVEILSVGDAIKLSAEPVRNRGQRPLIRPVSTACLAPESVHVNTTPASDVWCLGATLYEALTQRRAEAGIQVQDFESPFGSILERCLEADPAKRGTLEEIFAIYEAGDQAAGVHRIFGRGRTPAPVNGGTLRLRPLSRPVTKSPGTPARIFGIIALAVLAIVMIWRLWPRDHLKKVDKPTRSSAVASPARVVPKMPKLSPAHRSDEPPPAHRSAAPLAASRAVDAAAAQKVEPLGLANGGAQSGERSIWRAVVYTYSRLEDAQRKASRINDEHPDLKAEAFSPDTNGPFLVVVGGGTTKQGASQMLQQAVRAGLPRDSYIQNYNH
jgi:serine/threonine protein kinase